jgi:hypothetical protein
MVRSMCRRGMTAVAIVMVLSATLSLGGRALAQSNASARTPGHRPSTIAAFCAAHTSRVGFGWWSYGGHQTFTQIAVNVARSNHRQFEAVAGALCEMLHRVDMGHPVLVPDPSPKAPTRRRTVHRAQLVRAIEKLEQLPDAR